MSALILPQRFKSQPQYATPIDRANPLASGLVSATVFDATGAAFDRVTGVRYPVTNGTSRVDKPGRVTSFAGTGYVNTGEQSLGGVDLFVHPANQWSVVIYARLETAGGTGTFIAKCSADAAARTLHLYCDGGAVHFPGVRLRGALTTPSWGWSSADWHQYTITWDGSAANLYGDYDKEAALNIGSSVEESENIVFGARSGGAGGLLAGRLAYGYIYRRAISRAESIALYENPWQVFRAPSRKLWAASSTTNYTLPADSASFALTGAAANLEYNRLLAAAQGSFALTGTNAALRRGYALAADSATFVATGTSAALKFDRMLQADAGSAQVAGTAASLEYNRVLSADSGAIQITGTDATLILDTPGSYTLLAQPGSFAVSGQDAALTFDRRVSADSGAFAFTGSAATLRYARAVIAEAGVFALTGTDATLTRTGGPEPIASVVERTAVFRASVERSTKFQRSKTVTIRFN